MIFDHPGNYNHPERCHSRDYGMFAVNPFGEKDFDPNSGRKGGLNLALDESIRFRYRVIVHSGDVPKKNLAGWYSEYTSNVK
jgi:hypothetical protein